MQRTQGVMLARVAVAVDDLGERGVVFFLRLLP
jgi:hypothetical protein